MQSGHLCLRGWNLCFTQAETSLKGRRHGCFPKTWLLKCSKGTFVGQRLPHYIHHSYECLPVHTYKRTVAACYRCGTVGQWGDNCPHSGDKLCGCCGKQVGATTDGLREHECQPSCIICDGTHFTRSADCTGKFGKLHRPEAANKAEPATTRHKQLPRSSKMGKQGQQQWQPPQ